jgi:hypothetical protein
MGNISKKQQYSKKHNKTQKSIKHNKNIQKNGWSLIIIKGNPYNRGFQHGQQLSNELQKLLLFFPKYVIEEMEYESFEEYLEQSNEVIPIIKSKCAEVYEEMEGIVAGAATKGVILNIEFIIGWNLSMSLWKSHITIHRNKNKNNKNKNNKNGRCSSFIATGSYTKTGEIVMAHNTHTDFLTGRYMNIIMRVYPEKGHSFIMQTSPGLVWSMTDWFITDSGIIGCESTISDLNYEPKFGLPIFCRTRQIMQYAKTLDECANILETNSAGDYACSWLFGNINTNEIMLYEEGLKYHKSQKTRDGVFYAANSAIDPEIREKETTDRTFFDQKTSSGARMARLGKLLTMDYFGKLDAESAKKIIADHYNMHLEKEIPNDITICNHSNLNTKYPQPFGAVDGKVTTTRLAKKQQFYGRWGSSCGIPFNVKSVLNRSPKNNKWRDFLTDFPKHPWVKISI